MQKIPDEKKQKIIKMLAKGLAESYGYDSCVESLTAGIPFLFEHFKTKGDEEYEGDVIVMFCQDQLRDLFDAGYEW